MKTILTYLIGGVLMLGTFACSMPNRTSADAPSSAQKAGETPTEKSVESTKEDATSKVRRDQLNSDIRAREQRNNVTGGDGDRANNDLSSEVRSKLEANIPMGKLTVEAKDGNIVISGTVPTQEQLSKIDSLAKQIKGVKTVNVAAQVAPAGPNKQ
jgi:hyperosmotically inducible periplasmic protein